MLDVEKLHIGKQDLDIILNILDKYFPEYEVWAFGSRVKGNNKETSDLDLVIISSEKIDFLKMCDARDAFAESNIRIRIDILDWGNISENFRKIIKMNYIVIKSKDKKIIA